MLLEFVVSWFRRRPRFGGLRLTFFFGWFAASVASAALVDSWRASDLDVLNDGDAVGSWTSVNSRTLTGSVGNQPILRKAVTPAGGSAVRFNRQRVKMLTGSPIGGATSFSIAVVFRADAVGANNSWQWYGKTGIVDAEEGGVTADWGVVIDEQGQLGIGIGDPDLTVYSIGAPSLVDGAYHAAVFTWREGEQAIYLDNRYIISGPSFTSLPRNDAGFSIGGTLTGAGGADQRFVGDIVEVRFYDKDLSSAETENLIQELTDTHIVPNQPVIRSFAASTNQISIGQSVTLSWSVTNATSIWLDPGVGVVKGPVGSVQVFPRTNTTYTLTASNSLAVRTAEATVLVDQGIPIAIGQEVNVLANTPLAMTLKGTDPQGSNLTYTIVSTPAHGLLTGTPPNVTYKPESGYIGNDQFSFRVNDGEFDSSPASVLLRVLAPPTAPERIVLSTTNISVSARPGSLVAFLRAIDSNPDDTHAFALVPGFGDNAQFELNGNQLKAGLAFSGGLGQAFSLRVRVTDSSGLWLEQDLSLTVTKFAQSIVINEIHYNPPDNTVREEFIELHNPTLSDIDVSLWQIAGGIDFTIPSGTSIPGGGFLVLAQAPPTLLSRYGVEALGPWSGALSSDGETVTLNDANGKKVNEVSYKPEFPWPIGADGEGGAMALVNPGLDNDLGSSWRTEAPPSPGTTNRVFQGNAAPNIRQVHHFPQVPASTNQIVFTAKVTDPEGVASVQLQYQIVTPGRYLPSVLPVPVSQLIADPSQEPALNPDFENPANWFAVPMVDNGTSGDAQAADDIYTAVVPPQGNRTLVRYRVLVTDSLGVSRRAPFEDDPSLNFGCFVYDGIPSYQGISAQALQTLPVYFLLARSQDVTECVAYNSAAQLPQIANNGLAHLSRFAFNWPGTMVYDGVVYDHIRYRLRGANGRYQPGKRNWRFRFNPGHYLAARDQNGKAFPHKWTHLTTGKGSNNRLGLTFGLNEVINYFLWNKVGVPAPHTFFFHFRVVDGAAEAPDAYNGDFWGINWAQEDYDGRFLDAHKLAKGNLYKMINAPFSYDASQDMLGQQRYQSPFGVTNGSDGAIIQSGLLRAQSSDWIRAHVNCPVWYRYHAICEAIRHYDFWPEANKNAAWYFEPVYSASNDYLGRFWTLPWDTDSTWGATWNRGQDLVYNGIFLAASHPDLQIEYANTVREVRDLLFQPDQINPLIDAFAAQIRDFVPADLLRWSNAPAASGNYASLKAQAGFVSPALSGGLAGYVSDLKEFMFEGGTHPWWIDRETVSAGGWVARLDRLAADSALPNQPVIAYAGPSQFPVTGLTFRSSAFADPQGADTFAAMQWRVAEITPMNTMVANPAELRMEWDAVWDSGILPVYGEQIQVPATSVIPGHVYRARVRHQDNSGRW
ncbi:MAG TPA: CotH kinase family protein, partial [Clostridia bacterium]|nr:CotH kinase family protein [Clostridia bacterium]